jgi:hypothetical protein
MKILATSIVSFFIIAHGILQADTEEKSRAPKMATARCAGAGPSFSIEYLYWEIQEDQLYPVIFSDQTVVNRINENNFELKNQKFEYTSGFRAALGYNFNYEKYNVNLAWTRIHPSTTTRYSASGTKELIFISFFDQTDADVSKAGSLVSRWQVNYDILDLELGRTYAVGRRFVLRPDIGLKGGWIHQLQKMKSNDVFLGQPVDEIVQGSVNRRNDFHGIGPLLGIDLRYGLGCHLGLFSVLSGALLYGNFDLKTKFFLSNTSNNGVAGLGPSIVTIKNSGKHLSPTVQILLGGDWSSYFNQTYCVRFGAAYEVQYWWNQMRSDNSITQLLFVNTPAGGDLMIHGLTLQANVDF